jgi:hypothetical protein
MARWQGYHLQDRRLSLRWFEPNVCHHLRKRPAGCGLLVVVALGLVIFGVYSGCEARWREVKPG